MSFRALLKWRPTLSVPTPVFALIGLSILAHVTMSGGRVACSLYVLKHEKSIFLSGMAYSAFGLMPALLALQTGRWIDRVGPRHIMHIALLMMMSALAVSAIYPSLATILFTAILGGFGFGSYMLAANVTAANMVADQSQRIGVLAWLQMGNSVSAVVGPAAVGFLIDHAGLRAAFLGLLLSVCMSFAASWRVPLPSMVVGKNKNAVKTQGVVSLVKSSPTLLRIYFLGLCVSLGWDGFNFMTPVLGETRGYSATAIGLILSCFAVGTFAIRAILPWLSKHFSEWRLLTYAGLLAAGVFAVLAFFSNHYLHAICGFLFGLSAGVGQPAVISLIYQHMPPERTGEGAGLRAMLGNWMGLTGPTIYGSLASLMGAAPVFLLVAGVMGIAGWQARRGDNTITPHAPEKPE